jgi:cyclopropane-fatty-acyl-phospholipid synthase
MSSDSIRVSGGRLTARSDGTKPMSFCQSLARRGVFALLDRLEEGTVVIEQGNDRHRFGSGQPRATITVIDPACYKQFFHGGDIGAARAYREGRWDVDDLIDLVRIFVRNRAVFMDKRPGYVWLLEPFQRIKHLLRRNTPGNSRDNIRAHYDLGNDFFRQFLDDTMNYSCAMFDDDEEELERASRRKMDVLCEKLRLSEEDHLLEIGTGWGSLTLHAATEYGCRVTTTTLSEEQYEYTRRRVAAEGLSDRVTVLNDDYRELEGEYDKLISVEMIEAVGHDYLETFFETCARRLRPDGRMVLQAITMRNDLYESYRCSTDFIRHFIFPGGCLPSMDAMTDAMASATNFSIKDVESIGRDYVTTLRRWRDRYRENLDQIKELGFDEQFNRMWEYYLAYCEGGFIEGSIDNHQMVLTKPRAVT